ncbi:MAG: L,D-transpeptidase family protein [Deltaproteobacteria bacterium]|nr:L,D-transpeptidase family protein [Deltaproteobacteria bacterium]
MRPNSLLTGAALALSLFSPAPALPSDALMQTVRALQARGPQPLAGTTVTSAVLLPRIYESRGFEPLWTDPAAVDDLVRAIAESASVGLDPADYHMATIARLRAAGDRDDRACADLDVILTDALVRLAYHARFGKVDPQRLDTDWNYSRPLIGPDPAAVLRKAIEARHLSEFLDKIGPQSLFFRRTRDALAQYRALAAQGGWPSIPAGPALEVGRSGQRVAILRRRLAITADLDEQAGAATGDVFDASLAEAVEAFQRRHGLAADGVVGTATLRALNVPVADRIEQLRATLERCRWVLHDAPRRFVLVNVAGFKAYFVAEGTRVWETRVVVGKPYTKTPIFRADMKYIVLNPDWTIPASIVRNEVMPGMRRDPRYLEKKGFRRVDGQFVQPPGPKNALGRIKLMLPNSHSVYLHDTPSKSFFEQTTRTFSHGCVRVERPVELAALVLDDPAWSVDALERAIATGKSQTLTLRQPVPVLILYWTAAMDRDGKVEFLPDVYGRDAAIIRELHAPPRPPKDPLLPRS